MRARAPRLFAVPLLPALLLLALAGCGTDSGRISSPVRASRFGSLVLRAESRGPILLLFPGPEREIDPRALGLVAVLREVSQTSLCSAAAFGYAEGERAREWVLEEARRRPGGAAASMVAIVGYGYGGAAAGDLAAALLRLEPGPVIRLLVTVDAIKQGGLGFAAGAGASVFTLDRPIPGYAESLLAYIAAPAPDGLRLRRHVNYYQTQTSWVRGSAIRTATENHEIARLPKAAVRHGNADDLAAGMVAADLRACFRPEPQP